MEGRRRRRRAAATVLLFLLVLGTPACANEHSRAYDKERGALALLTVALSGGGLRKCTGVAVGERSVLAATGCVEDADDAKLVQVQLPREAAPPGEPPLPEPLQPPPPVGRVKPSKPYSPPKKAKPEASLKKHLQKKKHKKKPKEIPMQTRFARHVLRVPGTAGAVVLLKLTAPLDDAAMHTVPLMAASSPAQGGYTHCQVLTWGIRSGSMPPPPPRLVVGEARAGNWSGCWQGAGLSSKTGAHSGRRTCAILDSCMPSGGGAALMCRGSLAGLAPPWQFADPCGHRARHFEILARAMDWLRTAVPDLTMVPTASLSTSPSTGSAAPRKKRHHHHHHRRLRHARAHGNKYK